MNAPIALVTGGGSGIGRATCSTLAAAGRPVVVADIDGAAAEATAAMVTAAGATALPLRLDVTDAQSVADARSTVAEQLGLVTVLVNCAGWDELKPFLDTDEDFWQRVIEVNFLGTLRTVHTFLPGMIDAGWGRIVNVSSDAARVGSSLESVYAGAKGGVISFTKTIAREVARTGVTANVVCPGPTETPLLDGIVAASDDGEKVISAMARAVPMKRLGTPSDVATAIAYFASDEASFVTGQTLSVSGGLTMA